MSEKILTAITANGVEYKIGGATKVNWDANSNMNDFKTPGVYDIYGERRNVADNLPILNSNPGHSIAAKLTVVDSSLRKDDGSAPTEICVTQFLMLSNRKGGDGNLYVRTYNENNSPAAGRWTPWQKLQGIREGYIFTNYGQVNPDGSSEAQVGVTGLNNLIDNGIYSGIYTDDLFLQSPTFIETFTLIVINNYAIASKDSRLTRTISQLKYAVDAITNQVSIKQRTITDDDDKWTDWEEIGGGSSEVDITDAVKTYGLPTLIAQGFAKEGVTYKIYCQKKDFETITLDNNNKLRSKILEDIVNSPSWAKVLFNLHVIHNETGNDYLLITGKYFTDWFSKDFVISENFDTVRISADMIVL